MPARLRTTLLACALAVVAGGCGSGDDGTIPSDQGENLLRSLEGVEAALETRDCEIVVEQADAFASQVAKLPAEVDDEVERGLAQGAAQLVELSRQPDQCEDTSGATGEDGVETSTTTDTDLEEPPTTSTTDTTTSTETDEEEEPEEPPVEDVDEVEPEGGPPTEVPGGGGGSGEPRGGGSESGGLTGDKGGRG